MEVADDRGRHAHPQQALLDVRHRCGRLVAINRDTHHLGPGPRQCGNLLGGRFHVRRVGVGHGLDHDRGAATHRYGADINRYGLVPRQGGDGDISGGGNVHRKLLGLRHTHKPGARPRQHSRWN